MVELRSHPVIHGVALFARDRQAQGDVINTNGLGAYEIFLMAGVAGRREALELSNRRARVALVAIDSRVCADQGEAVQVLVNLLDRNIPSLDGMALLAVCPHLPLVDVGVTVGALRTHIAEDRLGMTLRATHAFVHAAQRIFRGVVIELRNSADRLPSAQRVAVLTGNAKAAMGTPRVCRRLRLPSGQLPAQENRQREYDKRK